MLESAHYIGVPLSQEPIPTVEDFLEVFMENWNGTDYQEEILQLLGHLSLVPFEGVYVGEGYLS